MWYNLELADFSNETRAALSLFLPFPNGMSAREFDNAARNHQLFGIAQAWENTLLSSCRLLVLSVPSGLAGEALRYARAIVSNSDGLGRNALDRLDPTLPRGKADYMRADRARRTLRRAFYQPSYAEILSKKPGGGSGGGTPQNQHPTPGVIKT